MTITPAFAITPMPVIHHARTADPSPEARAARRWWTAPPPTTPVPTEMSLLNCASRTQDQKYRGAERFHQEGARLGALLVLALQPPFYTRAKVGGRQSRRCPPLHLGGLHAGGTFADTVMTRLPAMRL